MGQFDEVKNLLDKSGTYYLIAVDMNSTYSYLNERYAEVFETIHGNLIGCHYAFTIHPDDQNICTTVAQMAFKFPNQAFPATLRKLDGEGGYIVTRWEYKAMFNEMDQPIGIFCIGHDITELLNISGELQEIKNNHSHLVRKHVANLTGLGKLIQQTHQKEDVRNVVKMIVQSAAELDVVIKKMYT